jgi:hypothetical protein
MKRPLSLFAVLGLALVGLYVLCEITGFEPANAATERIDPTVRHSPGSGVGGGSFWHSGFHGGK